MRPADLTPVARDVMKLPASAGLIFFSLLGAYLLAVLPWSGHTINIEEPDAFNAAVADFLAQVDAGRWPLRDPRAISQSITGMSK